LIYRLYQYIYSNDSDHSQNKNYGEIFVADFGRFCGIHYKTLDNQGVIGSNGRADGNDQSFEDM